MCRWLKSYLGLRMLKESRGRRRSVRCSSCEAWKSMMRDPLGDTGVGVAISRRELAVASSAATSRKSSSRHHATYRSAAGAQSRTAKLGFALCAGGDASTAFRAGVEGFQLRSHPAGAPGGKDIGLSRRADRRHPLAHAQRRRPAGLPAALAPASFWQTRSARHRAAVGAH